MSSHRAIGLAGFVACAGITGVWGLITPDRLYTFFLAAAVVCFIAFKLDGNAPRHDDGDDPEAIRDSYNLGYMHGLHHGAQREREKGGDGPRTPAHNPRTTSHLPKAG